MRIFDGSTYRDATAEEIAENGAFETKRATKAIAKGEYFYLDGLLCKAKTSIANGAILTLNTNYQVTNVEEELTKLNA